MQKTSKFNIGLALGAGAARGWAHLGVIHALKSMGIVPNIISGCSIGALVGASYACDKHKDLEAWARSLSSWDVFGLMDFSFNKGGLVAGEKVFNAAEAFIGCDNIEDLPIPFGCVTTEMETGREVWLTQGELKYAVSCSCAMPGLMAPRYRDEKWFLDGALVNPVPVSVCRALGADIVIAVNLDSDNGRPTLAKTAKLKAHDSDKSNRDDSAFWRLLGGGKDYINAMADKFNQDDDTAPPGILGVMSASINIMQSRVTRARMAGDPPEVLISPKVGHIGIMDFHCAEESIQEGIRATEQLRPQLEDEVLSRR